MAASVVQSATGATTSTAITATLASNPTVGNTLVAFANSDATLTISDNKGGTWTQRLSYVDDQGFYIWHRAVQSGTNDNGLVVTVTPSVSDYASLVVSEIGGVSSTPFDVVGSVTDVGSSGSSTSSSITTTAANDIVFSAHGLHGVGGALPTGFSWGNSFTTVATAIPTSGASSLKTLMIVGSTIQATAGATGATTLSWTNNASNSATAQIAFKEAAGTSANVAVPLATINPVQFPAPSVSGGAAVSGGGVMAVSLQSFVPSVTASANVSPGVMAVGLQSFSPVVSGSSSVNVTVPLATTGLTSNPPIVSAGASISAPIAGVSVQVNPPTVQGSAAIGVPVANIAMSAFDPSVSGSSAVNISVPTQSISLILRAPTVSNGSTGRDITLDIEANVDRFLVRPNAVNLDT